MSSSFDFGLVERITAGAIGEPGERVFYLQVRAHGQLVTFLAEKEQVRALAQKLEEIVTAAAGPPAGEAEPAPEDLALEEPAVPEWRTGPMMLEYDEGTGRVAITIEEWLPEDADRSPAIARLEATRSQVEALASRALEVVDAGRPRCQLCGYPMGPEEHACPALNGHRGRRTDPGP